MQSWKEKVTGKLTHLFSDSPSPSSPTIHNQSQARPYSKEGRYWSSLLSFILPSENLNRLGSKDHEHGFKPIQSLPTRWNSKTLSWRDRPLETYEECNHDFDLDNGNMQQGVLKSIICDNKDALDTTEENVDLGSGRSTSSSEVFEDASDMNSSEKSMPNLTDDSFFISSELYHFFQTSLPNRVKGCQWILLYSTLKHGISLRTLIRKSSDLPGPCLLITGDKQGAVFGGLLDCPLTPTCKRKYQGTNQTFVFTTIYGEPRLFRPTGANRYYYMCLNDLLALGGGGNFALRLDGELLTGTSGPCETFGNLCLAHNQEFELKNVELWGFTYQSQYLR